MRQLLKIMNYAAQLLALIDIRKQISEHLASKKSNQQHKKKETQPTDFSAIALSSSDPYRIQTCNLLIRSQTLYSIELRDHFRFLRCKVTAIFVICKRFCELF